MCAHACGHEWCVCVCMRACAHTHIQMDSFYQVSKLHTTDDANSPRRYIYDSSLISLLALIVMRRSHLTNQVTTETTVSMCLLSSRLSLDWGWTEFIVRWATRMQLGFVPLTAATRRRFQESLQHFNNRLWASIDSPEGRKCAAVLFVAQEALKK